jgi:hypothetical protein
MILNGYLLFDRTSTHQYLIDLDKKYFEDKNRNISLINEFDYINDKDSISKIIFKSISSETLNVKNAVIFIFTDLDCANCLAQEVLKLNELSQRKIINIVGLYTQKGQAKLKEIVERYAINFSVRDLGLYDNTFINNTIKKTPLILLCNTLRMSITDAYQPIPNDLIYRDRFYKRLTNYAKILNCK